MSSLNKIMLIGNLGKDPEVRSFPDGGQIANISIATKETWIDKASGMKKEATEWHRVVFNGKLAEIVGKYLRKGSQVYVEGSVKSRKWTDKDGVEKIAYEVKATNLTMLGKAGGENDNGGNDGDGSGSQYGAPARQSQQPASSYAKPAAPAPARVASGFDDMDDDIPF